MPRSSVFWASATLALLRHRRTFVMQTARTDCGVASALTVLNMIGRKADPVLASEALNPDCAGSSLEALRRYFEEQQGIEAAALAVPAASLHKIAGRAILHMQQQHYVVLLTCGRRGVLVFDPAMGPVYYPMADFTALYSGKLLEVRKPARSKLPAPVGAGQVVGGARPRRLDTAALFLAGLAARLLECALLLCLVAVLFLVLNHASFPSLLAIVAVIAACGGLLLLARQVRVGGEDDWARRRQSRFWRGLLRVSARDRDLNGFRGRMERDVSGTIRRGLILSLPQQAQIPAALGAMFGLTLLLIVLSPIIAAIHAGLFLCLLLLMQLDDIQVCRRSVRPGIGRYSRLGQRLGLPGKTVAPDALGEVAKWSVIGFAGFGVLLADLPPVALMFWILTAMQIVPLDFRRARVVMPLLAPAEAVPSLVGVEVPLRRQKLLGEVPLKVARSGDMLRIEGISKLTQSLQQPDLTVREQRMIMADVVRHALGGLSEGDRPEAGAVRIFGPGQDATQADFDHLLIARETRGGGTLPVAVKAQPVVEKQQKDPVLRNLHSCAPGDLPVFWDYRNKMPVAELQARLGQTGLRHAAHLTMSRLTLVQADTGSDELRS